LNFDSAAEIDDFDIENWIRRFDSDNDQALSFSDVVGAL
jgi:hypothetical protein